MSDGEHGDDVKDTNKRAKKKENVFKSSLKRIQKLFNRKHDVRDTEHRQSPSLFFKNSKKIGAGDSDTEDQTQHEVPTSTAKYMSSKYGTDYDANYKCIPQITSANLKDVPSTDQDQPQAQITSSDHYHEESKSKTDLSLPTYSEGEHKLQVTFESNAQCSPQITSSGCNIEGDAESRDQVESILDKYNNIFYIALYDYVREFQNINIHKGTLSTRNNSINLSIVIYIYYYTHTLYWLLSGEELEILDDKEESYWYFRSLETGNEGYIPSHYVECSKKYYE